MKKIISFVLTLAMVLSACVFSVSAGNDELVSPNKTPGKPDPKGVYLKFADLNPDGTKREGSGNSGYSANEKDYVKSNDGYTVLFDVRVDKTSFGDGGQMSQLLLLHEYRHAWTYSFAKKYKCFTLHTGDSLWPSYSVSVIGNYEINVQSDKDLISVGSGEWYRVAYKVEDTVMSIWLNGEKVIEYDYDEVKHDWLIFFPTYMIAYFDNWVTAAGDFDVATETGEIYEVLTFDDGKRTGDIGFSSSFTLVGEDLQPYDPSVNPPAVDTEPVEPDTSKEEDSSSEPATDVPDDGRGTPPTPPTPGMGRILLLDEFSGNSLDSNNWITEGNLFFIENGKLAAEAPGVVCQSNFTTSDKAWQAHSARMEVNIIDEDVEGDSHSVSLWWRDYNYTSAEHDQGMNEDGEIYMYTFDINSQKLTLNCDSQNYFEDIVVTLPAGTVDFGEEFTIGWRITTADVGTPRIDCYFNDQWVMSTTDLPEDFGARLTSPVLIFNRLCYVHYDNFTIATHDYDLFNESQGEVEQQTNEWTTPLTIEGWQAGTKENAPSAAAKFGTVKFLYSTAADGEYTETMPKTEGTYFVKAVVKESQAYTGLETDPVEFTITPKEEEPPLPAEIYIHDDFTEVHEDYWIYGNFVVETDKGYAEGYSDAVVLQSAYNNEDGADKMKGMVWDKFAVQADVTLVEDEFDGNLFSGLWYADYSAIPNGGDQFVYIFRYLLDEKAFQLVGEGEVLLSVQGDYDVGDSIKFGMKVESGKISCYDGDTLLFTYEDSPTVGQCKSPIIVWNAGFCIQINDFIVASPTYNLFNEKTEPEVKPGDVNGDDGINTTDVILILRHIAAWELENFNADVADVNGDGKVNTTDVILLLRSIANKSE